MCFFGAVAHQSSMQELDLLNPQLDPRISYTGGPKTYFGADGVLRQAAANTWPLEYDPITPKPVGRSVWEQRTNLLLRSEEYDNAVWTKSFASIVANATTAPDGAQTADKFVPDNNALANFTLYETATVASGVATAFSQHVKAAEYSTCSLLVLQGANPTVNFNLTTKTVTASNGASGYMVELPGGWFRCVLVYTPSATGSVQHRFYDRTPGARSSDGVSGIYVWGAQVEAGAFASPYIPTQGSQVTRAADVPAFALAGIRYNPAGLSVLVNVIAADGVGSQTAMEIGDGTNTNRILMWRSTNNLQSTMRSSGGDPGDATSTNPSVVSGAEYRLAAAFQTNNLRAVRNGGAIVGPDTAATMPSGSFSGWLGRTGVGGSYANSPLRLVRLYPAPVTNSELQAMAA